MSSEDILIVVGGPLPDLKKREIGIIFDHSGAASRESEEWTAPVDSARQISFNAPLNDVLIVNAAPGSARKQLENREIGDVFARRRRIYRDMAK